MDTKALKQKILDLAIHGKLVPQDPNDEPATELLEKTWKKKNENLNSNQVINAAPYQLPEGWAWTLLESYTLSITDGDHQAPPKSETGIPFLVISDVAKGKIDFSHARFVTQSYYDGITPNRKAQQGDILFTVTGSYGIVVMVNTNRKFCFQRHIGLIKPAVYGEFLYYILQSSYVKNYCDKKATGTAQKTVGLETLRNMPVPIPPLAEQKRIVSRIKELFSVIDNIENSKNDIIETISKAKDKILDLAISGKLLPKRSQWKEYILDDLLKYEQPQKYIVRSTEYSDAYDTPVLTAGKSFILGYTNEVDNIYDNLPCIIFDDFTTDCKYVDFKFKVKSSAMKILHPKSGMNSKFLYYLVKVNREQHITHKRYWISIVSQRKVNVPKLQEQNDIVSKVQQLYSVLDKIQENIK